MNNGEGDAELGVGVRGNVMEEDGEDAEEWKEVGDETEGECGTLLRETTVDVKLVGREEEEGETELWGTEDGLSSEEEVLAVVNAEVTWVVALVLEETGGSVVGERVPGIGVVGKIVLSRRDVETDERVGVLGVLEVGDRKDVENNDCGVDEDQVPDEVGK